MQQLLLGCPYAPDDHAIKAIKKGKKAKREQKPSRGSKHGGRLNPSIKTNIKEIKCLKKCSWPIWLQLLAKEKNGQIV